MTETTDYPGTPREVARAVLAAIEAHPREFDMDHWVHMPKGEGELAPSAPVCGTVMCAAGWAAYVTGWTLVATRKLVEITSRAADGSPYQKRLGRYAVKDGQRRRISEVATEALGLRPGEAFWFADADVALACLREIAGLPAED